MARVLGALTPEAVNEQTLTWVRVPAASREPLRCSQNQLPVLNTSFRAASGFQLWFLAERLAAEELLAAPLWSLMCCWSESTHSHIVFALSRHSHTSAPPLPRHCFHHSRPLVVLSKTFSPPSNLESTSSLAIQLPSSHSGRVQSVHYVSRVFF